MTVFFPPPPTRPEYRNLYGADTHPCNKRGANTKLPQLPPAFSKTPIPPARELPRVGQLLLPPRNRAPLPPPSGPRSEPGPGSRHLVLPGRKMAAAEREKPPPPRPPTRRVFPADPAYSPTRSSKPGRSPSGFQAQRVARSSPAVRHRWARYGLQAPSRRPGSRHLAPVRSLSSSAAPEGGAKTRPLYGTPPTRAPPCSVGRAAGHRHVGGPPSPPLSFAMRTEGKLWASFTALFIIIIIRSST